VSFYAFALVDYCFGTDFYAGYVFWVDVVIGEELVEDCEAEGVYVFVVVDEGH
jgi:hypothetical protein